MADYKFNEKTGSYELWNDTSEIFLFEKVFANKRGATDVSLKGHLGNKTIYLLNEIFKKDFDTNINVYDYKNNRIVFDSSGREYFRILANKLIGANIKSNTELFNEDGSLSHEGVAVFQGILGYFARKNGKPLFEDNGSLSVEGVRAYENFEAVATGKDNAKVDKPETWPNNPATRENDDAELFKIETLNSNEKKLNEIIGDSSVKGPCFTNDGKLTTKGWGGYLKFYWNEVLSDYLESLAINNGTNFNYRYNKGDYDDLRFRDIVNFDEEKLTGKGTELKECYLGQRPIMLPGQLDQVVGDIQNQVLVIVKSTENYAMRKAIDHCADLYFSDNGSSPLSKNYKRGNEIKLIVPASLGNSNLLIKTRRVITQSTERKNDLFNNDLKYNPSDRSTYRLKLIDMMNFIKGKDLIHKPELSKLEEKYKDAIRYYPADSPNEEKALRKARDDHGNLFSSENNFFSNLFGFINGSERRRLEAALKNSMEKLILGEKYESTAIESGPIGLTSQHKDWKQLKDYAILDLSEVKDVNMKLLSGTLLSLKIIPKDSFSKALGVESYDMLPIEMTNLIDEYIVKLNANLNRERFSMSFLNWKLPEPERKVIIPEGYIPLDAITSLGFQIGASEASNNYKDKIFIENYSKQDNYTDLNNDFDYKYALTFGAYGICAPSFSDLDSTYTRGGVIKREDFNTMTSMQPNVSYRYIKGNQESCLSKAACFDNIDNALIINYCDHMRF